MAGGKLQVIHEYSLALGQPGRRATHAVGRLTLNNAVLPGLPETDRRFGELQGLITARKTEEASGYELPDDFPVFVAHVDDIQAVGGRTNVLDVRINLGTMSRMTPGGRMGEVREICGAVASHMIEGPGAFPPAAAEKPAPQPQVPYWEKGRPALDDLPPLPLA